MKKQTTKQRKRCTMRFWTFREWLAFFVGSPQRLGVTLVAVSIIAFVYSDNVRHMVLAIFQLLLVLIIMVAVLVFMLKRLKQSVLEIFGKGPKNKPGP